MPTYTAQFHTAAEWAEENITAATPEKALAKARRITADTLVFVPYDDEHPVEHITIRDDHNKDLVEWQSDQLRLEKGAPRLLSAAQEVLDAWEQGDLAAAVRELNAAVDEAKGE